MAGAFQSPLNLMRITKMQVGYTTTEALLGNAVTLDISSEAEAVDSLTQALTYVEKWEPYLNGNRVGEQELSWPRDFIGAIPLAISQVQLLAARLIQQGIKLEVVDGVTTTDSEVELAEVKQMDTLMYPFLKNSGFF